MVNSRFTSVVTLIWRQLSFSPQFSNWSHRVWIVDTRAKVQLILEQLLSAVGNKALMSNYHGMRHICVEQGGDPWTTPGPAPPIKP